MTPTPLRPSAKLVGYQVRNVLRTRWLLVYTGCLLLGTDALFRFGGMQASTLLGVTSIVLLVVPLVALIFGTSYIYDAREFIELLLAQPLGRSRLYVALHLGLTLPMIAGLLVGLGTTATIHGAWSADLAGTVATLLAVGAALTAVFIGLALWIAIRVEEKSRGLGIAVGLWVVLGVVYDGMVLVGATVFADYPLEQPLLAAMMANPIDLARVLLLLRFDIAALMGYTGASFERFFGDAAGLAVASAALALWIAIPAWRGVRAFQRKDF